MSRADEIRARLLSADMANVAAGPCIGSLRNSLMGDRYLDEVVDLLANAPEDLKWALAEIELLTTERDTALAHLDSKGIDSLCLGGCGRNVRVDQDGLCVTCGVDVIVADDSVLGPVETALADADRDLQACMRSDADPVSA